MTSRLLILVSVCCCWAASVEIVNEDGQIGGDFDFADKSASSVARGNDAIEQRDQPAVEPVSDDGSGDEDGEWEESSGATASATPPAAATPVPGGTDDSANVYQATINFTSVPYKVSLDDPSSPDFLRLATELKAAIESLYETVPGTQTANIVRLQPSSLSRPATVLATVDLSSVSYQNPLVLFNVLNGSVNRGYLGLYQVSPTGFTFKPLTDGTSTVTTTCSANEFRCHDGACIGIERKCDGQFDCTDKSDEFKCVPSEQCKANEFRCQSGACIDKNLQCDGRKDCADNSDEVGCTSSSGGDTVSTKPCLEAFKNSQRTLLMGTYVPLCDEEGEYKPMQSGSTGHMWCVDRLGNEIEGSRVPPGSRPPSCSVVEPTVGAVTACSASQFRCLDSSCIDLSLRCDGYPDCEDASDELECDKSQTPSCGQDEFTCENENQCIDRRLVCNKALDCDDGSDEFDCGSVSPPNADDECSDGNKFKCLDNTCIDISERCDGNVQCPDGSDELECDEPAESCRADEFACDNGNCIPLSWRCNRENNCGDNSDEAACDRTSETTCYPSEFRCQDGNCVDKTLLCDGRRDCLDGSDELECEPTCTAGEFTCDDGTCIDVRRQCDGYDDCNDRSDERGCVKQCLTDQFTCADGSCVEWRQHCDGRLDCSDGSDEQNCPDIGPSCEFTCDDGTCIESDLHCDGKQDCRDGSDELHCAVPTDPPRRQCSRSEFRCDDGTCIPVSRRCDRRYDCPDRTDEYYCGDELTTTTTTPTPTCAYYEFTCDNGECIDSRRQCDRRNDCRDGSDERNCATPVTVSASPSQMRIREGASATFVCRFDVQPQPSERPQLRWTRLVGALPRQSSDVNGRLVISQATEADSGTYLCYVENSRTNVEPARVSLIVDARYGPTLSPPRPGNCGSQEASCGNGVCIPLDYLCDGDYDCTDRSDEANCVSRLPCEPNEFQCDNGKCIVKIWQCDGDDDCGGDKSDERNCGTAPPNAECRVDEFMCSTGRQCILKSYHCDGQVDCSDQSDEIGCTQPNVVRPPPSELMVQQGDTVVIECEAIGVPAPIIIWRLNWGNIGPPPHTTTTTIEIVEESFRRRDSNEPVRARGVLTIHDARKEDEGAYTCEAMNAKGSILAVPDTIVHILNGPPVEPPPEIRCGPQQFMCGSGECIDGRRRCDRNYDCRDGADEQDCGVRLECDSRGSESQYPDPTTNSCICKDNAMGSTCSECRPNAFHLSETNVHGCTSCFCMGHTTSCTSTSYNRSQVSATFSSRDPQGFTVVDDDNVQSDITVNTRSRQLVLRSPAARKELYWSLPRKFLGNKITSYGGNLTYTVQYTPGSNRNPTRYTDIVIMGSEIELVYRHRDAVAANTPTKITVPLFEYSWQRRDGSRATREHLMMLLADVESIKIRAVYSEDTIESSLSDVKLDIAENRYTGKERALSVEQCRCPRGYKGLSCEECDVGYKRSGGGFYLGTCEPCTCNGHSSQCDNGVCQQCQHNTAGEECEYCAPGYYGDATRGTPYDCQPCPCPLTSSGNQFSSTCRLASDGQVTCDACRRGYTGRNCERCEDGYTGDPRQPGGSCQLGGDDRLRVVIQNGKEKRADVGASVQFYCQGISRHVYTVVWSRADGQQLSSRAMDDGQGTLSIDGVQPEDAGVYKCTGSDFFFDDATDTAELVVGDDRVREDPPRAHIDPDYLTVNDGDVIELRCTATGNPVPRVVWVRGPLGPISANTQIVNGVLRKKVTKQDEGVYECRAESSIGVHLVTSFVVVEGGRRAEPPVARIDPEQLTVNVNDIIELRCTAVGFPEPRVEWVQGPHGALPVSAHFDDGVLRFRARKEDEGSYQCRALNSVGADLAVAYVTVQGTGYQPPTVLVEPDRFVAQVGDVVALQCSATGYPEPRVEWVQGPHGDLSPDVVIHDGLLRFRVTGKEQEGVYSCRASNSAGSDMTATSFVVVEGDDAGPEFEVVVDQPTVSVRPGEDAQFQCTARSRIAVEAYNWTKYGDVLPPGAYQEGGRLIIPECRQSYSGQYVCTIYLVSGERKVAYTSLVVEDFEQEILPERPEARAVGAGAEHQTIREGSTITLRCEVTGYPPPTVQWTKSGEELGPHHQVEGNTLRIRQATVEDRGVYICEAHNVQGSAYASFVIEIERHEAPVIELYPGPVQNLRSGDNALFQCRVTGGTPPPTLTWTRAHNEAFGDNTDVDNDSGLIRFNGLTEAEQGDYICTASNDAGTVTAMAALRVEGAPKLILKPAGQQQVEAGGSVTLECAAEGNPAPQVEFHPPIGVDLEPVEGVGAAIIYISRVSGRHSGTYTCVATTPLGQSTSTVEVLVEDHGDTYETVHVTVGPHELRVPVGQAAEFECRATSSLSRQPTVRWSKNDGLLPAGHSVRDGVLRIHRVNEDDAGSYRCSAEGEHASTHEDVQLFILTPPIVTVSEQSRRLRPGDPFRVQCSAIDRATGESLYVEWSRRERDLHLSPAASTNDGVLEIVSVTAPDAGLYQCSARNEAGSSEAFFELIINAPPSAIVTPRISHQNVGATAEFRCEVTGSPHPRVVWSKENGVLPRGHSITAGGGVLTLFNVRPEDDGRYICGVTNEAGTTQDFGTLRVTGADSSPQIPDQYQTVQVGDRVEIDCTVTGSPRPTVQWIKVNGELSSEATVEGAKLIIPYIVQADQGTYRCIARSASGTAYRQVFITVEAPPVIRVSRQSRTVSMGSRVKLTCQAQGNPPPYLVWSKRGGDLPSEHTVENGLLIIPSIREEDFGEYICHARNKLGHAEAVIELVSGELVPYFEQNDDSYVSLPAIKEAYRSFDLEASFKPQTADGLILYNGQLEDGSGDFVSLGMRDSRVEFRLDVGSGPAVITSEPLPLDTWHKIRIKREGRNATMYIGDTEYKGQAPGAFIGLDLTENLYVGSVPDYNKISRAAGYSLGFSGCVSRLIISGVPVNLGADGIEIKGVSECPVCQSTRQCKNGGTCLPAAVDGGFSCRCAKGYSGPTCELVGERCTASSCSNGGKCVDLPGGNGYRCVCPVGLTGKHCEHGSRIHTPMFNANSFISYPTIRDAVMKVQLRLQFKATSLDDGLLLYNGYDTTGTGDFVSLSLKQGHVVFQFDTGSGPATIRSRSPINVNQWVTVVAERSLQDGSLIINDEVAVKGSTTGGTVGLNLKTALYVGGVDWSEVRVSSFVGIDVGFRGCVSQLSVGGSPVDLINGALANKNVEDCADDDDDPTRTCRRNTCQNGGTCLDLSGGQFQCRCPLGFTGIACDERAAVDVEAEFMGEGSYIELPSHLIPRRNSSSSDAITLSVVTTEPNGLLLWQGATSGRSKDYMAVTVENGFPVFRYDLGSGPANITGSVQIDDGEQHEVTITRTGKFGTVEVDGSGTVSGVSAGQSIGLDTRGNIFLGGLPSGNQLTGGRFPDAFVGCILDVYIQKIGPLNLTEHAVRGVDVKPCDV